MESNKALFFVYNAHSGMKHSIWDSIHKLLSPNTYECDLCKLTYGPFSENRRWKKFRSQSTIEMNFLHKDEYQKLFKSKFEKLYDLPVILFQDNYELSVLVGKKELGEMKDVKTLIDTVQSRL
jgi:hypothetical protein